MRRLIAYREVVETTSTPTSQGRISGLQDYPSVSPATGFAECLRFEYDLKNYVVLIHPENVTITDAQLIANGIPRDFVVISMPALEASGGVWRSFITIADAIALAINGIVIYNEFDAVNNRYEFVVGSDGSIVDKNFANPIAVSPITDIFVFIAESTETTTTISYADPYDIEIDNETALGVTFEGFDFANPDRIGLTHSNSFTLPNTSINQSLHGFFGLSDTFKSQLFVDYIIDNNIIIEKGSLIVKSVGDRINCMVASRNTIWDKLKSMSWPVFMEKYYRWVKTQTTVSFINNTSMINALIASTAHIGIRGYQGKHGKSTELSELYFFKDGVAGGQICTFVKSIFQYIQVEFGVDFTGGGNNVLNKYNSYIPNSFLTVGYTGGTAPIVTYSVGGEILTKENRINADKGKKSVYDFVKSYLVYSNCMVNVVSDTQINLHSMDDFENSNAVDFSNKIDKGIELTLISDSVAKINTIDFASYSELLQAGALKKSIVSENLNTVGEKEIINIKTFIPAAFNYRNQPLLWFSEKKAMEDFTFLIDRTEAAIPMFLRIPARTAAFNIKLATLMPIGYNFIERLYASPMLYKIQKWLTIADIPRLKAFQRYGIKELQGTFMLSKVSGFNPEGVEAPTEIEFIRTSYEIPYIPD